MITTDHPYIHEVLLLHSIHNTLHILSQWVFQSKGTEESELNVSVIKGLLEFFSSLFELYIPLVFIHLEVGKGDHSQWLGRHRVNFSSDFLSQIWAKLNNTVSTLNA
jgi:hypothetical protein